MEHNFLLKKNASLEEEAVKKERNYSDRFCWKLYINL